MHNLFRQSLRRWLLSAGLALLLCLAIGFSVIGMTAWRVSERQASALRDNYVTIAVAKEQSGDRWGKAGDGSRIEIEQITPDGSVEWTDGMWTFSPERIANTVAGAPGLKMVDHRCMLGAHVAGKRAIASGTLDELDYNELYDRYRTNMCVLAVECTDVTVIFHDGEKTDQQDFSAKMKILERISLLEDYQRQDQPEELEIWPTQFSDREGNVPFEEGKTYLVLGFFLERISLLEDYQRQDQPEELEIWPTQFSDREGNVPFEEGKTYLVLGFFEDIPITEGINEDLSVEQGRFVFEKRRDADWPDTRPTRREHSYLHFGIDVFGQDRVSISHYATLPVDNVDYDAPGIRPED